MELFVKIIEIFKFYEIKISINFPILTEGHEMSMRLFKKHLRWC